MKKEKNSPLSKLGIVTCITTYNGMENTDYDWLKVVAKFVVKHTPNSNNYYWNFQWSIYQEFI